MISFGGSLTRVRSNFAPISLTQCLSLILELPLLTPIVLICFALCCSFARLAALTTTLIFRVAFYFIFLYITGMDANYPHTCSKTHIRIYMSCDCIQIPSTTQTCIANISHNCNSSSKIPLPSHHMTPHAPA
jgi:hypothetical protein